MRRRQPTLFDNRLLLPREKARLYSAVTYLRAFGLAVWRVAIRQHRVDGKLYTDAGLYSMARKRGWKW